MVFLIIFAGIICFCTGLIVGLFIRFRELELPEEIRDKRPVETTYQKELKNFFNYDGTNQE